MREMRQLACAALPALLPRAMVAGAQAWAATGAGNASFRFARGEAAAGLAMQCIRAAFHQRDSALRLEAAVEPLKPLRRDAIPDRLVVQALLSQ